MSTAHLADDLVIAAIVVLHVAAALKTRSSIVNGYSREWESDSPLPEGFVEPRRYRAGRESRQRHEGLADGGSNGLAGCSLRHRQRATDAEGKAK
jgi:hypothetical protein